MMLNDDDLDDGMDDDDKEPNSEPKNRVSKAAAKQLKVPHGLQAPPGLNIFSQKEGEHAFKYFGFSKFLIIIKYILNIYYHFVLNVLRIKSAARLY